MLFNGALSAQDHFFLRKLADKYNNNFYFYKAIPLYEHLLGQNPGDTIICRKLAGIYNHINDSRNAERCYKELVASDTTNAEYFLKYAQALARNGKYSQAERYFYKFSVTKKQDVRGKGFAEAYNNMEQFFRDSARLKITRLPFSTDADEFSPAIFGKSIVFSSDRAGSSLLRTCYNWTQSPYLDHFVADPDSTEAAIFSASINTVYHEGPVSFSRSQDTILFTRSNSTRLKLQRGKGGVNTLGIYQAVRDAGRSKWEKITPVNLNSKNYSVEHPAFTPDGRGLIFASDMPGGFGEMDLYFSELKRDSAGNILLGNPVNLGKNINTPGTEVFPFVDKEGNLWYASDGIPGLGGLDIFFAAGQKNEFSLPVNPGYPLNTRFDDFGYVSDGAGDIGYFSSNRGSGLQNDDIFKVTGMAGKMVVKTVDNRNRR